MKTTNEMRVKHLQDTILKIEHVSKFYPGVTALNDVSFEIKKGEVHALCGENGAGKSTLIKCIMGVEHQDQGTITMNYNGEWITNSSAVESQAHGVFANYQSVTIAPDLSIAENYFLGCQPKKNGLVDWRRMAEESQCVIDKFEMKVDPRAKIRELTIAMQAMVTISKISINDDIKLVILDEPTALLENDKVEILFRFVRELKERGVSVIYISHRLEEVIEICDTVTILKDGTYVNTLPVSEVDKDKLIAMMVGRPMSDIYNIEHFKPGEELLRVENFSDSSHFRDISFTLHRGEILGFVGLVGAGRSEIMRAVTGVEKRLTGDVYINGKKTQIRNPSDASIRNVVPSDLAPIINGSQINHIYTCGAKATALYHRYCEPNLAEQGITLPATALPSTSPAYAAATLGDLITAYRARIDWNAYRTPVVDGVGRRPTHRI